MVLSKRHLRPLLYLKLKKKILNLFIISLPMRDGVVEETLETIAIFKIKKKRFSICLSLAYPCGMVLSKRHLRPLLYLKKKKKRFSICLSLPMRDGVVEEKLEAGADLLEDIPGQWLPHPSGQTALWTQRLAQRPQGGQLHHQVRGGTVTVTSQNRQLATHSQYSYLEPTTHVAEYDVDLSL
jgi:hypothetical protein